MDPPSAPATKPSKSSLKKYKKGEREQRLSQALNAWRQRVTVEKYGEAILRDVGSSLVLPNELLERLVDCSHYGKITNMEQLGKEVDWILADEYGPEVVRLIMDVCPPQPRKRGRRPKKTAPGGTTARRPLAENGQILNAQPEAPVVTVRVSLSCSLLKILNCLVFSQPASSFYNNPLLLPSISQSLTARAQTATSSGASSTGVKRKRCSVCGQEGHNSKFHYRFWLISSNTVVEKRHK